MHTIDCYFDVVSPYAYLAFEQLPQALQGLDYRVHYRPVLFGALLQQHGQVAPVDIAPKREWIYRHALWQAHTLGLPMQLPAAHPFNPLALLRLAWACPRQGTPNRWVCETVLRHVWRGGAAADDAARLAQLAEQLAPAHAANGDTARQRLRQATAQAAAAGVFGVPTFVVTGRHFWGLDALPMLRAQLAGDPALAPCWDAPASVAQGPQR